MQFFVSQFIQIRLNFNVNKVTFIILQKVLTLRFQINSLKRKCFFLTSFKEFSLQVT